MKLPKLVLSMALVLATNAVVLVGVARNRSGDPDAVVELTERELRMPYQTKEDTGLSLRMTFSNDVIQSWGPEEIEPHWFDREKLEAVGFDCSTPLTDPTAEWKYRKARQREAFVVLELEGPAWRAWLKDLERDLRKADEEWSIERAKVRLEAGRRTDSRLLPVDVGLDGRALRSRYSDRSMYLIVPAVVRLWFTESYEQRPASIHGVISRILVEDVHVPRYERLALERILAASGEPTQNSGGLSPPRYKMTVTFGSRHEPWVSGIAPLTSDPAPTSRD